jgi:hypothetical protein
MANNRTYIRRIDKDLDDWIKEISIKNNIKFTQASKDLANLRPRLMNKKVFREIIF